MHSKWRILSSGLFLFVLVSVLLLGLMQADAHNGFPYESASQRQIQRGRYLVTAVGNCVGCHSPNKTPDDPQWLAGYLPGTPGQPFQIGQFRIYASNITPDLETGIGSWTPQQIFNSLRHGQDKQGKTICPPMPWIYYRDQSDRDNWAIVAYLSKGIKPVRNQVPENTTVEGTRPNCAPLYQNLQPLPSYPADNEIEVRKNWW
ncbi:MAG: c-type cytochrome [Komarekiella atlantica HA4396-MV6]|jgi:mono/diheme cytochrome c family protein|nr:c-type cytochrome [Komarekiella atlantica HA4396-MV6]